MTTIGLQEGWAENRPLRYVSAGLTPLSVAGMYVLVRGYDAKGGPLLLSRHKQILDSVPGMHHHSALRLVHFVEVPADLDVDAVRSVQDVMKRAIRIRTPGMIVNAPVVPVDAQSSVYPVVPAWYESIQTGYLDIGPMPVRAGSVFQPIHGIDKSTGKIVPVEGQKLIFDALPSHPNYSPIWRLHYVRVPEGFQPDSLRSVRAIFEKKYPVRPTTTFLNAPIPDIGI
ncbi:MAG TPA: hypothetical protein VFV52_09595 [Bacilli bacterium]|nr:hypothetical protein [Bacilli bacterium]